MRLAEGDDRRGFIKDLLSHQPVVCKSEPYFSQKLPKLAQQASALQLQEGLVWII